MQAYKGYFQDGRFVPEDGFVQIPDDTRVVLVLAEELPPIRDFVAPKTKEGSGLWGLLPKGTFTTEMFMEQKRMDKELDM
ncbi:MAG: hypothetical protein LBE35_08505 [Clostridiales bacterium]|nr:hypothetical protein [Clostridiales bacterium]